MKNYQFKNLLGFVLVTGLALVAAIAVPAIMPATPGVIIGSQMLMTLFTSDIQRNLFPDNAFYRKAKLDVSDGKFKRIQVPQAGATPQVFKNPSSFPLSVNERNDSTLEYEMHTYATEPIAIEDKEELEISYNKRRDVLADHLMTLETRIADDVAFEWAPTLASNYVRTTGATGGALAPGATGARRLLTKADFIAAATLLNKQDIPQAGRICLLPADMMGELLNISDFVDYEKIGSAKLVEGFIGRLVGFDIMVRSRTQLYDNAGTPARKAVGAAGAATDNLSALFWHPLFVRLGTGPVKVFTDIDKPEYLGSIMNATLRCGAAKARTDQRGVVSIIQAHV